MAENDIWTVKAALDWTCGYLERKGDENPRLSAEWLLSEACGLRRIELYTSFERPLSLDERDVLRGYVTRRGRGEPLQYITGEVAFRHIAVKVRPGVLIPRPETEVLVSEALSLLPDAGRPRALDSRLTEAEAEALLAAAVAAAAEGGEEGAAAAGDGVEAAAAGAGAEGLADDAGTGALAVSELGLSDDAGAGAARRQGAPRQAGRQGQGLCPAHPSESGAPAAPVLVADLCTGSGCIACSIAYEHPQAQVVATDIAPEAVALARENAAALGLGGRVQVVECDLGEGVPGNLLGRLDLVVSNPPYVPTAVLAEIPREVADFEPALALDGGADGLDVLRRLLPWCAAALKPGGGFAFELHETCLDAAAELAAEAGFADIRITRDLAARPRVLTARLP